MTQETAPDGMGAVIAEHVPERRPPVVSEPRPHERSPRLAPDLALSEPNVGPRTMLFVGSGALENAWTPIRLALEEAYPFVPSKECENLVFANLIFQLRWLAAMVHLREGDRTQFEPTFQRRLQAYNDLKRGIASRLTHAVDAGEVRVRPAARQLDRLLEPPLLVVTTNWCKSVERFWPNAKVLHLHGTVDTPDTLYLPAESIEEPYRSQPTRPSFLAETAGETMAGLHVCSRLVVYGLSLSPLDPELGIVLNDGLHGRSSPLTDAFVVDRSPKRLHHRVGGRNFVLEPSRTSKFPYLLCPSGFAWLPRQAPRGSCMACNFGFHSIQWRQTSGRRRTAFASQEEPT